MSDRIDAACTRVQERIDEIDEEIRSSAALVLPDLSHAGLAGAARRVLGDRVLERLILAEILAARDEALASASDLEKRRLEHEERVEKPRRAEEARRLRLKLDDEAGCKAIIDAMWRVKSSRPQREKPNAEDVALLRRSTWFDGVPHLLHTLDHEPWWPR